MEKVTLTSPFKALEFEAIKFNDGSISVNDFTYVYDQKTHCYLIPAYLFDFRETLTVSEAAKEFNVSQARIFALTKSNKIEHIRNKSTVVIFKDSLKSYFETRKNGRPRKEVNDA